MTLHDASICVIPKNSPATIKKESKGCLVRHYDDKPKTFLNRECIAVKDNKVILYKRVSSDFKTQENTSNETLWLVGSTVTHKHWAPETGECGSGKFHACSMPYFCDDFRNLKGDRYIAIEIAIADLHEWPNPSYPHKIAFREGKVLFVCNRHGKELKQ